MERKTFLGLTIGALIGLLLLFIAYSYFFKDSETGKNIRNNVGNFLPIGGDSNDVTPRDEVNTPDDQPGFTDTVVIIPKLRQISDTPIAGYIGFDNNPTTTVRYIEKSTGHIFETNEFTLDLTRLSNTTLGLFNEAYFSNPSSFVARTYNSANSNIETYIGGMIKVGTTTNEFKATGTYMAQHPTSIALRGTSLFTLYESDLGADGYLTQTTPLREVRVFNSPLSGWNAEWINKNLLLLTTKPNSSVDGFVFSFNPSTKKMTELMGQKPGLTAKVNSDITAVLFSESIDSNLSFYMKNITKNISLQLSSKTLPEKCVFSDKNKFIAYCAVPRPLPLGNYPEDWYKGKVQFSDAIVKIDIETNTETALINLEQVGGVAIDATNLTLNPRESFIYFINKQDGFLWSFDLR